MRKIFVKLARLFGYEIIDQNKFISPSLNKELNEDLSILNDKSIIETLYSFKRAGSNAIVTYFADRIAKIIK